MKTMMIAMGLMAALGATGCSKQDSAGEPTGWCEAMHRSITKRIPISKKDAATKAIFLEECVAQPADYLRCEATDWFARRDERCAKIVRANDAIQSRLNHILMTGRAPDHS